MISVIVPLHPTQDRAELLQRKMQALQQSSADIEIITVSHGAGYALPSRCTLPWQHINAPSSSTSCQRNAGAAAAQGDWLLFSDDDVVLEPDALEVLSKANTQHCWMFAFTFAEGHAWQPSKRFGKYGYNNLNGVGLAIQREAFNRIGGFAQWIQDYGCEDLELGYRLQRAGVPIGYLANAKAQHLGPTPTLDAHKARMAGAQAYKVAQHYQDWTLTLELGVHPVLLMLKLAFLPSLQWIKGCDYELAYAQGAWGQRFG